MNYVEKFFDGVSAVFRVNPATFSGAIDVIVVEQEDGSLRSTPFHVRFGKLELLTTFERNISIFVNDQPVPLVMRLGRNGEGFFVCPPSNSAIQEGVLSSVRSHQASDNWTLPMINSQASSLISTPSSSSIILSPDPSTPSSSLSSSVRALSEIHQNSNSKEAMVGMSSFVLEHENNPPLSSSRSNPNLLPTSEDFSLSTPSSTSSLTVRPSPSSTTSSPAPYSASPGAFPSVMAASSSVIVPQTHSSTTGVGGNSRSGSASSSSWSSFFWPWGALPRRQSRPPPPAPPLPLPSLPPPSGPSQTQTQTQSQSQSPSQSLTSLTTIPIDGSIPPPPNHSLISVAVGNDDDGNDKDNSRSGSSIVFENGMTMKEGNPFVENGFDSVVSSSPLPPSSKPITMGKNLKKIFFPRALPRRDSESDDGDDDPREDMEVMVRGGGDGNDGNNNDNENDMDHGVRLHGSHNFPIPLTPLSSSAPSERSGVLSHMLKLELKNEKNYDTQVVVHAPGPVDSVETDLEMSLASREREWLSDGEEKRSRRDRKDRVSEILVVNDVPLSELQDGLEPSSMSEGAEVTSGDFFTVFSGQGQGSGNGGGGGGVRSESSGTFEREMRYREDEMLSDLRTTRGGGSGGGGGGGIVDNDGVSRIVVTSLPQLPSTTPVAHNTKPRTSSFASGSPKVNKKIISGKLHESDESDDSDNMFPRDRPTSSSSSSSPHLVTVPTNGSVSMSMMEDKDSQMNFSDRSLASSLPTTLPSLGSFADAPALSSSSSQAKKKLSDTAILEREEPVSEPMTSLSSTTIAERPLSVQMSLCGPLEKLTKMGLSTEEMGGSLFEQHRVTEEQFSKNAADIVADPRLVVRLDGCYYPYAVAATKILGFTTFGHRFQLSSASLTPSFVPPAAQQSGWFSWGRTWIPRRGGGGGGGDGGGDGVAGVRNGNSGSPTLAPTSLSVQAQAPSSILSVSLGPPSSLDRSDYALSASSAAIDISAAGEQRTLRATSTQLKLLNLRPGRNTIVFRVTSRLQGTKNVMASIYLWDYRAKIVVSDIDGTITKSDVMGHLLPTLGRDWSHAGVARLYSNIVRNSYKIIYVTSRPIGHANRTRGYISNLKQSDDQVLPEGPVLMSPERLLASLHTELVLRRADQFKIACLTDIRHLFSANPFFAGFGNRPTDAVAYRAMGISPNRIFIIDYKGEIRINNHTYKKSYTSMNELVHEMFPPPTSTKQQLSETADLFNSFQYWRKPVDQMDDNERTLMNSMIKPSKRVSVKKS